MALRLSTSCRRRARFGKPHRMSVSPVASHTRTPCRDRYHRRVIQRSHIRSKTATSTLRSTITRRPFAVTTSRVPVAADAVRSVVDWTSDTIRAGTNPLPDSRQAVLRDKPCATKTEAVSKAHDAVLSPIPPATPKTLLDNPQLLGSRRRPDLTISRRRAWRLSVRRSIPTVSYRPDKLARWRSSSDEYQAARALSKTRLAIGLL